MLKFWNFFGKNNNFISFYGLGYKMQTLVHMYVNWYLSYIDTLIYVYFHFAHDCIIFFCLMTHRVSKAEVMNMTILGPNYITKAEFKLAPN